MIFKRARDGMLDAVVIYTVLGEVMPEAITVLCGGVWGFFFVVVVGFFFF